MKAELKGFYSTDLSTNIEKPLSEFHPEKGDEFGFWATIEVGKKESKGADNFELMICTPKWLLAKHKKDDIIFARHYMIVFEYNYQRIYDTLKNIVESVEEETWDKIGEKIGRIGHWEFEDYKEYDENAKN